ncbi:MAG: winged helix-turn-helix domain-containing protein [Alphaproteobacteria bacterium]|nr:winged helix-turn-helix domain-containing protein [Alphaproteobacteria bacterium]
MLRLTTCTVDLGEGLVHRANETIALTSRELAVLRHLRANEGRTVSRDELLCEVFGLPDDSLSRVVDTMIRRLRVKLEVDPACPESLLTVYGEGYRLRCEATSRPRTRTVALDVGVACLETGRLDRVDGTTHVLVGVELVLLEALVAAQGRVLAADELERRVWGTLLPRSNRLRNLVYRLRGRIEREPGRPAHLRAVRGVGYRFDRGSAGEDDGGVTVVLARVDRRSPQLLWEAARRLATSTGGQLSALTASGVRLVFPERAAAVRAYEELAGSVRGLQAVVIGGRRLQPVLAHQTAQRMAAAQA